MGKSGFIFAAFLAVAGVCGAGEEYMPLVPGAYSPADFGGGGDGGPMRRVSSNDPDAGERKRPSLMKNIIRLTVPSLGKKPESKMRMVEASPDGPNGTLRFRAPESMPGTRHADIPGLVPPEYLAVSRMEMERQAGPGRRGGNFTPISLPSALGTEELKEFDPYSVQRTGNPFKDAPGRAEAFPAAATRSQSWEPLPFENGRARRSDARGGAAVAPVVRTVPEPLKASEFSKPKAPAVRPVSSVPSNGRGAFSPVPAPLSAQSAPPLPELSARTGGREGAARRSVVVSLPPPLPERVAPHSSQLGITSSGLMLPLPPTALNDGGGRPGVAVGPGVVAGGKIIEPQAPVLTVGNSRQVARAVPVPEADEFTPMRGLRVY